MRFVAAILIIFLCAFSLTEVEAQKKKGYLKKKNKSISKYKGGSIHFSKNKRYLSVGGGLNFNNYFGDLAPRSETMSTNFALTRPGFSLEAVYRYTPNFSFRGNIGWYRIQGDDFSSDPNDENDRFRYGRNLQFRNDIFELSAQGIWDIFGNHGTFLNRVQFTPYVWAGVSVLYHEPKGKVPDTNRDGTTPMPEAGQWVKLRPLGTEGQFTTVYDVAEYSSVQFSVPAGIGIRASLSKRLDFSFELGYKILFTDYIDDVSGMFIDLGALDNDLSKVMSDRSIEPVAVVSGEARNFENLNQQISYVSQYDGQTYETLAGYGHEHPDNIRGNSSDNDQIFVTSFKITYILTGSFQRAKFR